MSDDYETEMDKPMGFTKKITKKEPMYINKVGKDDPAPNLHFLRIHMNFSRVYLFFDIQKNLVFPSGCWEVAETAIGYPASWKEHEKSSG